MQFLIFIYFILPFASLAAWHWKSFLTIAALQTGVFGFAWLWVLPLPEDLDAGGMVAYGFLSILTCVAAMIALIKALFLTCNRLLPPTRDLTPKAKVESP